MRIVLVDPSRTVLKCVARMLESRGHSAHQFSDGGEALAFIAANVEIDALITSCELATGSGLELCWQARLLAGSRRPFYIILMSSSVDRHTISEALDSGADEFIRKPPVAEELYARLRSAERLNSLHRELLRLATTDSLTGLPNRRAFFEQAEVACRAARTALGPSVVIFDIDHFKHVNDTYGHDVGDTVLRGVADAAGAGGALCARIGGEEFVLMLEGTGRAAAAEAAETLRARIAALEFDGGGTRFSVTSSFGVAECVAGDSIDDLLKRADTALYAAKTGGRNRVATCDGTAQMSSDPARSVVRSVERPRRAEASRSAA
jgi:two-component system, cell cycle response regulator